MPKNIDKITTMESKILELGKKQHDKGYRGGVFTPGSVRSETEYSYRAINVALEALIEKGLVEKTVTSAIRDGAVVELDVYKITNEGMDCLEKVTSGSVKVYGREPSRERMPKPEPRQYSKPWEDRSPAPRSRDVSFPNPEIARSIRALEIAVLAINENLKALQGRVNRMSETKPEPVKISESEKPPETAKPTAPAKPKISRSAISQSTHHRLLILESVNELDQQQDNVLADDLKERYIAKCSENGFSPKGMSQFTPFLKRLEGEGIISLKRVGCKNLGIKGQGSRVVVKPTPQGQEFLDGHA
ncbi:MAG: hypothetical protein KKH41_08855 [Candidatus Thermoplasmatota archaeon]|nr:hypothetical protein [Euryarchaeota archaeon]MBU4031588.1 hypothetical protein [Candidatus Thermoplasmatota archaeon]MBU4071637.1 hypothetical protein [Candidatus Thermoplasmatota archaeon]MBU4144695.1 hypothetical protein [Candidatus Thermoplasmatota archaeon]MBU4592674.1 hypothetical protein [Candidatus Thermoplasmatota archaeon]